MNNTKIELKDLVWKEIDIDKKLSNLDFQWYNRYIDVSDDYNVENFYFDNAEQIAKEKAEILNKQEQYTKDDIIEMFVNAGFEWNAASANLQYKVSECKITIDFDFIDGEILMVVGNDNDTFAERLFEFPDRKSIEFYYNKFREILEFEVAND